MRSRRRSVAVCLPSSCRIANSGSAACACAPAGSVPPAGACHVPPDRLHPRSSRAPSSSGRTPRVRPVNRAREAEHTPYRAGMLGSMLRGRQNHKKG